MRLQPFCPRFLPPSAPGARAARGRVPGGGPYGRMALRPSLPPPLPGCRRGAVPDGMAGGQPGEEAYLPKRWKGSGLSTDYHLSGYSDQSKVVELTAATFNETVAKHKGALVAFCMKDTGQTDALLIEFGKLGIEHHNGSGRILIGKVDAVKERELAERHGVVHYPTIWWYVDGKPVREYPEDASRFDKDLTNFMARQLAPVAPAIPEGAEEAWAKAALQSIELNVLGHFESDDAPLLRTLRRAVLLREHVSASYTVDAAAYARTAQALQVDVGTERPLLLVKPYDERVVQLPTAELSALPFDQMVAGVGASAAGGLLSAPSTRHASATSSNGRPSCPSFRCRPPPPSPRGAPRFKVPRPPARRHRRPAPPGPHSRAAGLDPAAPPTRPPPASRLSPERRHRPAAVRARVEGLLLMAVVEAVLEGSTPPSVTLPNPTGPNSSYGM